MPAKGSKKRTAPEAAELSTAKRGQGQPPRPKDKRKETADSERVSQNKTMIHIPRRRAERAIAESSDDDSKSEIQDQEVPPVVDDQKWDSLLLEAEDKHEIKGARAMQLCWRKSAAKEAARLAEVQDLTKEMYEAKGAYGCPDPTYNEDWSHANEERFLSHYWRGTVYEAAIERQTWTSQDAQHLVTMFKTSLQIFRVDPLTLWTLNDDEFKVTGSKLQITLSVGNATYNSPIWSRSFCDSLSKLMIHPTWGLRKDGQEFMLFAVKWAIKCRTDDRRPLSEGDAKLLQSLGCPITPRPEEPLKRTLKGLLEQRYNAYKTITTEADLLRCLADDKEAHLKRPASRYYHVTWDDLEAVMMGLDESKMWMSCEAHYALHQKSRSTTHTYPANADIAEIYRNAELPLRLQDIPQQLPSVKLEQDERPSVARDPGQVKDEDHDVTMVDSDNSRSQSLEKRMNEHRAGVEESNDHELKVEESKPRMATSVGGFNTAASDTNEGEDASSHSPVRVRTTQLGAAGMRPLPPWPR
ncbi:hypothetical protein FBULB1_5115 [Fusarium bulbicola]|nr:hypothetical protein FBULB1_5115 [Fusarium bulbicola]